MQPQYSQGAAPSHQPPPYSPTELSQTNNGSVTSSLRQWRKKDFNEKQGNGENSPAATNENISHIARVAPHTYYPRPTNDVCYQYNEYSPPFKPPAPAPVKYSEIVENQQAQTLEQLKKQKEKEYADLCGIAPQAHMKQYQEVPLKQPYAESVKQQYAEQTIHHQYISKDPQMSFIQKQPQIHHQYIQKDQFQPYMPKFNGQAQYSQTYPSESNNFLAHLSKINPRMAQSIINDAHLRDSQMPMYHNLEPRGSCQQSPQRIYHGPSLHPNSQSHRNLPQGYNYPQTYNYNVKSNMPPNDSYGRVHQYQHNVPKYMPDYKLNMEPSIPNIPTQRVYSEGVPVNYSPLPSKGSPNYSHCAQLEYAQHYQHRRQFPQDYFTHPSYKTAYLQNQGPLDENDPEGKTRKSSLKQYLENWVDEDMSGNLPDIIVSNNLTDIEGMEHLKGALCIKNNGTPEQQLYVLDTTEITNENLPHFLHLQQFEKLPDNIRGYYHSTSVLAASGRRIIIENQSNGQIEVRTTENGELPQKTQEKLPEKVPNVENKVVQIHIVEDGDSATNSRLDGLETIIIQASDYQNERLGEESCLVKKVTPCTTEALAQTNEGLKNMPVIDESNPEGAQKDDSSTKVISENRNLCNIAVEGEKTTNLIEEITKDETISKLADASPTSEPKENVKLLNSESGAQSESSITSPMETTILNEIVSESETQPASPVEAKEAPSVSLDSVSLENSPRVVEKSQNVESEEKSGPKTPKSDCEDSRDYFSHPDDSVDEFYDDRVSMQTPKPLNLSMDKRNLDDAILENFRKVERGNSSDFSPTTKIENSLPVEGVNLIKRKENEPGEEDCCTMSENHENSSSNLGGQKFVPFEQEQPSTGVQEEDQNYSRDMTATQNSLEETTREETEITKCDALTETDFNDGEKNNLTESVEDTALPTIEESIESLASPEVDFTKKDFVLAQTAILTPLIPSPVEENVKAWESDGDNLIKEDKIEEPNLEAPELETGFPTTPSVVSPHSPCVDMASQEIEKTLTEELPVEEVRSPTVEKVEAETKDEIIAATAPTDGETEMRREESLKIKIKIVDNNRFALSNCLRTKKKSFKRKVKKAKDKGLKRKFAFVDDGFLRASVQDGDLVSSVASQNVEQATCEGGTVTEVEDVNTSVKDTLDLVAVLEDEPISEQLEKVQEEPLLKEDLLEEVQKEAPCDIEVQSQNDDFIETCGDCEEEVVETNNCILEKTVPMDNDLEILNHCSPDDQNDDFLLAPTLEIESNEYQFRNFSDGSEVTENGGSESILAENLDPDLEPPKLEAQVESVPKPMGVISEEQGLEYALEESKEEETSVVYQINDSNIVLQIADELLEINVTAQNGKKVILVKTFSNAIIMNNADENDNTIEEGVREEDEIPILEPENLVNELDVGQNCELSVGEVQMDELQIEEVGDEFCVYNEEVVSSSTEMEVQVPPKEESPPPPPVIEKEEKSPMEEVVKKSYRRERRSNSENDKHSLRKTKCLTSDNLKPKIDLHKYSKLNATGEKPSSNLSHKSSNHDKIVDQITKVIERPPKGVKTKAALKIVEEPKIEQKVPCKILKSDSGEKREKRVKRVSFKANSGGDSVGGATVRKSSESSSKRPKIEKEKKEEKKEEKKVVPEQKIDKVKVQVKVKEKECGKSTKVKSVKSVKVVKDEKVRERKKRAVTIDVSQKESPPTITPVPKTAVEPILKEEVIEEKQEKQISVQENSITSSTPSEVLIKEPLKVADEWENDPDDAKHVENAFKRRLSLEEYNKRKHLSLEKEINKGKVWSFPKRRVQSPETPMLNVNFNHKTYSRNLSCSEAKKEKEEPLSSAIELQLPKIHRTPPPKPNLNQEYLKNALLNDLHTVNAYTVSLIKTNQQLMQRFLEQQRLTVDELKKVKKIIRYKRLVQHLSTIRINETHSTTLKENYLTKDLTRENCKRTDLLTNYDNNNKKIDPSDFNLNNSSSSYTCKKNDSVVINEKRKRKRFRFLYSDDDTITNENNEDECSKRLIINNEVEIKKAKLDNLVPAMDYSVRQSNSLTLVFKRSFKSDPKMQPFVKIERLASIDLLAKNNCF